MKKLTGIILLAVISVMIFTAATDSTTKKKKKGWKGTITFAVSYEGEDITPASVANMPKKVETKVMGDKTSAEFVIGPLIQTIIENPEFDAQYTLLEYGLKKFAIKQKLSEIRSKRDSAKVYDIEIDLVNETKVIAGYECKKAVVTFTPLDTTYEELILNMYYSPELGDENTNKGTEFEGVPGLLLEFYNVMGKMRIKYVATEIKKGGVKEADFLIPTDYKIVTKEELQKEFGG